MTTELTPEEFTRLHEDINSILSPRERRVLTFRFGLFGGQPADNTIDPEEKERAELLGVKPRTRRKMAAERMGIPLTRFDEILTKALAKLRVSMNTPKD
jgi:DNA-directed RNA polymerase sigma subunit (sigma70/sigma32)